MTNIGDPAPQAEWKIWYQDTFDREVPRRVEVAGVGLVEGLMALWSRHLFETVQADGTRGFSRFNLWWTQEGRSIRITGEWAGQIRLRAWVFGNSRRREDRDTALLRKIALAHSRLVLAGETSAPFLAAASEAESRAAFEMRL